MVLKDPRIGTKVSKYIVERPLGRGGMGKVFLATHRLLGKVAVKFLDVPGYNNFPSIVKRFEGEARALVALRGTPHIATILDVTEEEPFVIITEFIEGSPFSTCLDGESIWNKPAELRYLDVVVKISGALVVAHRMGIIHRDVKPENVMIWDILAAILDPSLIDFGISKMTPEDGQQRLTTFESIMGSFMWGAPEQLLTPLDIDHTVDIFSLGVILFFIFNRGVHLYGEGEGLNPNTPVKSAIWVTELVKDEERTQGLLEKINNPKVREVIWSCIRYEPGDRVQSMEELHNNLKRLYEELSTEHQEKSVATTAEIETLSEEELESDPKPRPKRGSPYQRTLHGVPTDPGLSGPPGGDKTARDMVDPDFEELQNAESALEDLQEHEATERIDTESSSKRKLMLVILVCILGAVGTVVIGFMFAIQSSPKETPPKKHAKSPPKTQMVKDSKPPIMRRVVKKITPPMKPMVKKPKDPCERDPGTRPSDKCVAMHYNKATAACWQKAYWRHEFKKNPGRLVQCLSRYAKKLRGYHYDNFDKAALATLFVDEVRTHFCFKKRYRNCDKKNPHYYDPLPILPKVCGSLNLHIYAEGIKLWKRSYLGYIGKSKRAKVLSWIETKPRKARTKKIRAKWLRHIRKQSPKKTTCLTRD